MNTPRGTGLPGFGYHFPSGSLDHGPERRIPWILSTSWS